VTFTSETTKIAAALKPNAASPFTITAPAPGSDSVVVGSDVDMDPVSGVAYAVIDTGGGHVRASRLSGSTWTEIGGGGHDLDGANDDTGDAGSGSQKTARVAVDTSGNSVVAWSGTDAAMKHHIFALRINGTATPNPSVTISKPSLGGKPADGNNADMINIDGGGSPNPWIVFREQFTYDTGRVRALAVQLVGNTPSAASVLDGLPLDGISEGAENPRIDVNSAGQGLATSPRQLTLQTFASSLSGGLWSPGFRLDAGTPTGASFPNAAITEDGRGLLTWVDTVGAPTSMLSRTYVGGVLGPPVTLSRNGEGQILGTANDWPIAVSSASAGSVAFAFGQSSGATANEIVAGVVDLPAGSGPPPPPPKDTAPTVSGLKLSRTTFAIGSLLPKLSRKTKVGTTISFKVDQDSTTTFAFSAKKKGFKVGRRCKARAPKGRKAKRCTRLVRVGGFRVATPAGSHKERFQGRISRRRTLRPGSYRLTLTATDPAGNQSKPKFANFRLKRK
jgi:hypothetical protein